MRSFFFGLGYSSQASARWIRRLGDADLPIGGTVRTQEKAERLRRKSIAAHVFEGSAPSPALRPDLADATHLFFSIAPGEQGDPALTHHEQDIRRAEKLAWMGYFSTVGVYGDAGGAWIDETATPAPVNSRSKHRVAAERAVTQLADEMGVPLMILRLAGIYGPGRSAFDKLRAGTARRIVRPGQVFNRIHVEDIGRVAALAARERLAGIYNLADDEPAPPQDLVEHAAKIGDFPVPPDTPFEKADLTAMARSFYSDNKRVSNAVIKQALGIELLYPTYRAGLRAIREEEAA